MARSRQACMLALGILLAGCATGKAGNSNSAEMAMTEASKAVSCDRESFDIYFGFDETSLNEQAKAVLADTLERAEVCAVSAIRIEGYADSVGAADTNRFVSEKRAEAVKSALVAGGILVDRISVVPFGEQFARQEDGLATPLARRAVVTFLDMPSDIS